MPDALQCCMDFPKSDSSPGAGCGAGEIIEGQFVWRKLLIVCVLAALPLRWIAPSIAARGAGVPAAPAITRASGTGVTPEVSRDANRIALVIGNADYADGPLANPINDARAMSWALARLGFKVSRRENLTQQGMQDAILEFKRHLSGGGVGLFYFSGHGFRTADKTLLAPVDVNRATPARLLTQSVDLGTVLDSMSGPRSDKLNLIVLDTCLNNPFQGGRGQSVDAPERTLIAYATAPGTVAVEATSHGLYTAELLKAMTVPGQDVTEMFRQVASGVRDASGQRQLPWTSSSLPVAFRFVLSDRRVPVLKRPVMTRFDAQPADMLAAQGRGILPKDSAEQYELTFWESIKDSTHASDYEAYLQAYPNGRFAALSRGCAPRRAAVSRTESDATAAGAPGAGRRTRAGCCRRRRT